MNYDDYCSYLDKFKCIIESANTLYVCILGDLNAKIQSQSIFGSELIELCDMNKLCYTDRMMFYLVFLHLLSLVADVSIVSSAVCSDHLPLSVHINCDCIPLSDSNFVKNRRTIHKWHLASEDDKPKYYSCTHDL